MTGETLAALLADLRRDEGLRLKPYYDTAGKITIGFGRNLTDVGISTAMAEDMLRDDALRHALEVDGLLPWVRNLDPVRQRAIYNMAFNLGVPGLLKFKQFLAFAEAGKWQQAAVAMLQSRWAGQVGLRADRLAAMIRDGVAPR